MSSTLKDKHVVVTGGGTGVGAEIAQTMALAGAKLTIMGRSEEPLRRVAKQHEFIGYVTCDVTDAGALRDAISQARALNGPVSVVVANAGAAESVPFARMSPDQMQAMLSVNLLGVFNTWQACLEDMKSLGWGRMIAIASTAGLKGYPYVSGYSAAKHGVIGLTRSLALELAPTGITVNAICPGFIATPMLDRSVDNIVAKTGMSAEKARATLAANNPQNRFVEPREIADCALWLCSDGAGGINGHALPISGGEV